jgi:hypothetical protein
MLEGGNCMQNFWVVLNLIVLVVGTAFVVLWRRLVGSRLGELNEDDDTPFIASKNFFCFEVLPHIIYYAKVLLHIFLSFVIYPIPFIVYFVLYYIFTRPDTNDDALIGCWAAMPLFVGLLVVVIFVLDIEYDLGDQISDYFKKRRRFRRYLKAARIMYPGFEKDPEKTKMVLRTIKWALEDDFSNEDFIRELREIA